MDAGRSSIEGAAGQRILIVEDDEPLGALMMGALEGEGYRAELVTTLEAARGPYDLIVADYFAPTYTPGARWPQLDRLRALGTDVPIIGCTGHLDARVDEPGLLGVAAVAIKPFDLQDLLTMIERLLAARARPADHVTGGQ
ncbi:MAG: hypothetical protein M3442_15965 [Chloroflexota bacterium]|nr:hypothetical protein [Chloroflexota bacterium]